MLDKVGLIFLCLALLTQRWAPVGVGSVCWGLTITLALCIIYREKKAGRLLPLATHSKRLLTVVGIYFLCLLPSLFLSYDSVDSLQRFAHKYLYYTAPVLIGSLAVKDIKKLYPAFVALLVSTVAECLFIIYHGLTWTGGDIHVLGFKGAHHNGTGSLFAILAPMLAVVCLDRSFKKAERICAFAVLIIVLAATVFQASRATWLSILIALPLGCLPYVLRYKKKLFCCLCCVLVLGGGFAVNSKYSQHFRTIGDIETNDSNLVRFHLWHVGIVMLKDHPLGIGLGQYDTVNKRYYKEKYSMQHFPLSYDHLHSIYMMALVEGSLPALAGLLYLYLSILYANVCAYFRTRKPAALMLAVGVLSILIFGLTDFVNNFRNTMLIWWFLAGALTMAQEEKTEENTSKNEFVR